ncbi:MAG: ribbon-helix-helix protein, CopG family [Spirochaetales bacterium]|nr:ribbon-helix-helix protein, CopG family [Spirochaetales bacterium]
MRRTQIYLDENMFELLRRQSKAEKKTISEIIRRTMEAHLQNNVGRIRSQVDRVTGIRRDREGDVDQYVRSLRQDRQT